MRSTRVAKRPNAMHLVVLDNGQIRMTHDLEWGRARVKREVLISERLLSVDASRAALYVACERSIARLPPPPSSLLRATDTWDLHFPCVGPSVPDTPSRSWIPAPLLLSFLGFRSPSLRIYRSLLF